MKAAGATLLEGADPGELTLLDGKVVHPDGRSVAFRHAAGRRALGPGVAARRRPRPPLRRGRVLPAGDPAATADDRINSSLCYGFVAEIVAVRIDPDTLEIEVDRVSSVHDAGTVLDQTLLDGQVYGALVHGLGGAAYE
ncbi:molybdopterin cofactor-binding domain-containing protein [Pseudonocardia sp. ICBG1293]|uniref:molybdopterin cofactor-binding domain-containing protein n=1 Tax=Pseudonocardia sp. ICBG1293 TaxID=2844382 RepID=UPI0027DFCEB8|nr:molybdopterin cofactor-binding domain-containing protein [Pseudonocardia sp. ICBG1293]